MGEDIHLVDKIVFYQASVFTFSSQLNDEEINKIFNASTEQPQTQVLCSNQTNWQRGDVEAWPWRSYTQSESQYIL